MGYTIAEKSKDLTTLAKGLIPSKDVVTTGNQVANTVFNILRSNTNFVDRVIVAGSMGKTFSSEDETDERVYQYLSDFDLVVFCNHDGSPSSFFHSITNHLSEILKKYSGVEVFDVSRNCIAFTFKGYDFDLIPAINYVNESVGNVRQLQKERTYDAMDRSPYYDTALRLNGGLAETSVYFAKNQSSLAHAIVRIAKYWAHNLETNSFSGFRLLVETVAIYATLTIENSQRIKYQSNQMYYAVREFLRLMKDFPNLYVVIRTDYTYELDDVPEDITNADGPIVMDPANYYNNLAANEDIVVQDLVDAANWSLQHLDKIGRHGWNWSDIF